MKKYYQYPLKISPSLINELKKKAKKDYRSLNKTIELILNIYFKYEK